MCARVAWPTWSRGPSASPLGVMTHRATLLAGLLTVAFATAADSGVATYRGFVVLGPEVETFRICGSRDPLWLDARPALWKTLRSSYDSLRTAPYQEVYAVLRGSPGPKLRCGFCEEYPGSFRVEAIVALNSVRPRTCK